MMDWDYDEIEKIQNHYNKLFPVKLNLFFFIQHYEDMYKYTLNDMNILPDLLDNISYYTKNGVCAKHKILLHPKDEEKAEKLFIKRHKQREKRSKSLEKGLMNLYLFQIREIEDFIKLYPQWKDLISKK